MASYRVRSTGQLVGESEIRAMYPNSSISFSENSLNELGIDLVFPAPQPTIGRYQAVIQNGAVLVDGKWFEKWEVIDLPPEVVERIDTVQSENIRRQRNQLLFETDWTQLTDSTVNRIAWAEYRQLLRNIPQQSGFPWDLTWPTKPI